MRQLECEKKELGWIYKLCKALRVEKCCIPVHLLLTYGCAGIYSYIKVDRSYRWHSCKSMKHKPVCVHVRFTRNIYSFALKVTERAVQQSRCRLFLKAQIEGWMGWTLVWFVRPGVNTVITPNCDYGVWFFYGVNAVILKLWHIWSSIIL